MSGTTTLGDVLKAASTKDFGSGDTPLGCTPSGSLVKQPYLLPNPSLPFATDADTAPTGFSRTNTDTAHLPAAGLGGFLLTLNYDWNAKSQVFFAWYTGIGLYYRKKASGSTGVFWAEWKKVTVTDVAS